MCHVLENAARLQQNYCENFFQQNNRNKQTWLKISSLMASQETWYLQFVHDAVENDPVVTV